MLATLRKYAANWGIWWNLCDRETGWTLAWVASFGLFLTFSTIFGLVLPECIKALPSTGIGRWRLPELIGRSFNGREDVPGQFVLLLFACFVPVGRSQLGRHGWWICGSRLFIYGTLCVAALLALFWADGGCQLAESGLYTVVIGWLTTTLAIAGAMGAVDPRPRTTTVCLHAFLPVASALGVAFFAPATGSNGTLAYLWRFSGWCIVPCLLIMILGWQRWLRRGIVEGASLAVASLWVIAAMTCEAALLPYH